MKPYKQFKKELLKDKKTKKAYDNLEIEFELVKAIIRKRTELGFTQADLAKKLNTKQSAISRLERGDYNPTISLLRNLAKALNAELHISFL